MRKLRDGFINNQCYPHLFFQVLHPTYARSNVVHVKKRDELIVDLATIITRCVHYFKEFIYPQLLMINGMSRAHHEFYDVVGCIVHYLISHDMDVDFTEDICTRF